MISGEKNYFELAEGLSHWGFELPRVTVVSLKCTPVANKISTTLSN